MTCMIKQSLVASLLSHFSRHKRILLPFQLAHNKSIAECFRPLIWLAGSNNEFHCFCTQIKLCCRAAIRRSEMYELTHQIEFVLWQGFLASIAEALMWAAFFKVIQNSWAEKCPVYHSCQKQSLPRNSEAKNTSSSMIELQAATSFSRFKRANDDKGKKELRKALVTLATAFKSLWAFVNRQ